MNRTPKILVVGSFVMDLIVSTGKFPDAGETVLGKSFRTATGGKGANQAVQAARLGAVVTMVGKVGNDDFGRSLIHSCKEAGINTDHVVTDPSISSAVGNVQLEEKEDGTQNRIIVVPGANMTITREDVAFLKDAIDQYDMVILQLEIPMAINEVVSKYAHDKGVPVMLNSAPSAPISSGMLSHLAYISPNEHEAYDLTGVQIRKQGKVVNQEDVKAAVNALLDQGVQNVIITLGNAGAVVANRNEFIYQPCVDVVKVLDPTAAGDSFVGAFSAGVCSGMNHSEALTFANYTATLTVSRMGAQPSLPHLQEVEELLRKEDRSGFDLSLLDKLKGKMS